LQIFFSGWGFASKSLGQDFFMGRQFRGCGSGAAGGQWGSRWMQSPQLPEARGSGGGSSSARQLNAYLGLNFFKTCSDNR